MEFYCKNISCGFFIDSRMSCTDQVKPLKDFQELIRLDVAKDLPKATIRNPAARGCKFSINRNGSDLKLEKVPDTQ